MSGVTKSFGDKQVLRGIDIEVAAEESLAIIGTSGCGKSVTLKCLLGLLRADGGSIRVDGEEMIHVAARSFGLDAGGDKAADLAAIEMFLHEEARNGRRALLIVDEAQNLSIGALEELRML